MPNLKCLCSHEERTHLYCIEADLTGLGRVDFETFDLQVNQTLQFGQHKLDKYRDQGETRAIECHHKFKSDRDTESRAKGRRDLRRGGRERN